MGTPLKERRRARIAKGLCCDCMEPAEPFRVRCKKHLEQNNAESLKKRDKWHNAGRCNRCGRPLAAGPIATSIWICPTCLEKDCLKYALNAVY